MWKVVEMAVLLHRVYFSGFFLVYSYWLVQIQKFDALNTDHIDDERGEKIFPREKLSVETVNFVEKRDGPSKWDKRLLTTGFVHMPTFQKSKTSRDTPALK